tara:strand:- start:5 stop:484 length:480 start_codon:yes stop_codon:yes gene_type:complete
MSEEVKKEETKEKKKGFFGKMKEAAADSESQLEAISTMVRLGILVWSGGILTLAYIKLPAALGIPEQKLDPTFIASVFTGVLATFGVQTAKKSNDGTMKMQNGAGAAGAAGGGGITKADLERLIAAAAQTAPAQTIRIEQAPIKITTQTPPKSDETYKM